jgi:hypothetical protein
MIRVNPLFNRKYMWSEVNTLYAPLLVIDDNDVVDCDLLNRELNFAI